MINIKNLCEQLDSIMNLAQSHNITEVSVYKPIAVGFSNNNQLHLLINFQDHEDNPGLKKNEQKKFEDELYALLKIDNIYVCDISSIEETFSDNPNCIRAMKDGSILLSELDPNQSIAKQLEEKLKKLSKNPQEKGAQHQQNTTQKLPLLALHQKKEKEKQHESSPTTEIVHINGKNHVYRK